MTNDLSYSLAPRDRRNLVWVWGSALLWAVCIAGTTVLLKRNLLPAGVISWFAAMLPMVIGGFVIWTHIKYLRTADELQRRIQLYAMSIGFGVTVMATLSYAALELIGAPSFDRETFVVIGVLTYVGSYLLWSGRYR